jgi:type VI secretion system secreted protein VgrG
MEYLASPLTILMSDPQHRRILRLTFPHDDGPAAPLLANCIDAVEGLSRDFEYVVEVLSDNARISLKQVLGRMISVELVRGDGSVRYFNGYAFEFKLVRTDGSYAFYRLVLRPWMAYLKLRRDNYVFHDSSLREQTEQIFSDYGTCAVWDARVAAEDPKMTMACQFGESDHNYVHRRWEAAGWHYWYEHSATEHKLVLSDDSIAAPPIDGPAPSIRFQKHGGSVEEDGIGDWSPSRQIVAGHTALTSFDFKHPQPSTVDVPTMIDQGSALSVESYDYAGAYGFRNRQDGDARAELGMEAAEARGEHFDAEGNSRYALPGRAFSLLDHFDIDAASPNESTFLILSVVHSATNNYLQGEAAAPDYHNTFTCMRKNVKWRPGRDFNSVASHILGPQTAIVVGPADQEIHTDEHGRVKVQFHWDRIGTNDERSSAFVRVASSWASGQYGAMALPRIGDEVIINWLDANPDLPIITGRVYNGANTTPWDLPSQGALSGIRSHELKGAAAGKRNNHLLLDDTNGQIQAVLASDHQHSQLSLGYLTRVVGRTGRRDYRGEGYELRTDGWGSLRAAKGLLLTTWKQAINDDGTTQQDNTEGADTLRAVLDSAASRSQAAEMASNARGERKHSHLGLTSQSALHEHSWSLSKPIVFITAPDGIAASTPQSIVHAAGEDLGNYAVGYLDLTAGKILSLSAAQGMRHHVERGGHSTVVSHGDYHVHVHDGKTELVSQKGITIEAKTGDITLKTKGGSIVLTEAGAILIKGAKETHEIAGTLELGAAKIVNSGSVPAPETAPFWGQMNVGKFSQQVVLADLLHMVGNKAAHYGYKIIGKDGAVLKTGKLDAEGKSERVFTEDMEELHAEIDVHNAKWQIARDERHAAELGADAPAADALAPVGVSLLAEKTAMPMELVRGLFQDDGKINAGSMAMSVFESRLQLPAASILALVGQRSSGVGGVAAGAAAMVAADTVHDMINAASARLLAALGGHVSPGAAVPQDVHDLFAQAEAQRTAALPNGQPGDAAGEVVIEDNKEMAMLSQAGRFTLDLDAMPSDLRGEAGSNIA